MKDNFIFAMGKDSDSEEEKSTLQKVIEDVRTSVFSVFYLLLKNQEATLWKYLAILIVEYL